MLQYTEFNVIHCVSYTGYILFNSLKTNMLTIMTKAIMFKTIMLKTIMMQAVETRQLAKENTFNTSFSSNGDRPPIQVMQHYDIVDEDGEFGDTGFR